jgi:SAM-dependent methyltransferase
MRFEFGRNWKGYVQHSLDDERVEVSRRHLLSLAQRDDLAGLDFLDIGCGSGVHSLAALKSGASKIHSFDFDPNSVEATKMVQQTAGNPPNWVVERGDVLDSDYVRSLNKWSFVYSWGVLHHTGDVWRALANAQMTVADGGTFYVALYSADVQSDPEFWLNVKRQYNQAGGLKRWGMVWWYVWNYVMHRQIRNLPNLIHRVLQHRYSRGMSFFTDIRDWLGGWPMEFVRDQDVIDFLTSKHGLRLVNIKTGEACTEFVFTKSMEASRVAPSS